MFGNSEVLANVYNKFIWIVLIVFAVMLVICLIRAIIGPKIADRLVGINMMGTMVMIIITIFSELLGEGYLLDICLIYAMVSFLAVVMLSKIYIGIFEEKHKAKREEEK